MRRLYLKRFGLSLILFGAFLLIASIPFVYGYHPAYGIFGAHKWVVVLKQGEKLDIFDKIAEDSNPPEGYTLDQKNPSKDLYVLKQEYKGRIEFGFKWFFALDMMILFSGISLILFSDPLKS